jgi:hypothetical protein
MPIFQHNGALHAFIHIPKCGGTTVEAMLAHRFGPIGLLDEPYYGQTEPYRWSKSSPQHLVWDDFIRLIPDAMIDRVFAVTRHPLTRFASSYNFYARSGAVPAGMGPEEWFAQVAELSDLLPFRADNHLRRQSNFVPDRATLFRLEDGLDAVSEWLDATFGVAGEETAQDGNVAPKPQDDGIRAITLPDALRRRVEEFYADDYARFGYDADPGCEVKLTVPKPRHDSLTSRLRVKLLARRIEHRVRRLESRALTAATRVQRPKGPAA